MSAPAPAGSSNNASVNKAAIDPDAELLNKHTLNSLDELQHISPLYQSGSVGLLVKVLSAVVANPDEAKFRRVNAVKLLPKLRTKAGLQLLETLGFKHASPAECAKNPTEEEFMTCSKVPDSTALKKMRRVIERLEAILASADKGAALAVNLAASPAVGSSSAAAPVSSPLASPVPKVLPFKQLEPVEGDTIEDSKFVLFWHPPGPFGQWTMVPFVIDGVTFVCPEQYMMAEKARLFKDHTVYAKIMTSASSKEHKKLGRQVANFDPKVWDEKCVDIVVKGNYAKFSQHPAYGRRLLATGNKILVEASPLDQVWGVGMSANDPNIRSPSEWHGKNLLGVALMRVRDMLREAQAADGVFH